MDNGLKKALEHEANGVEVSEVPWMRIRERIAAEGGFVEAGGNAVFSKKRAAAWVRSRRFQAFAASILVAGAVFSSGFVSPAMADVLSKLPIVGSIFQVPGASDSGLRTASLAGYELPVNRSVVDHGVKLTFTNMIADENRTSIGYKVEFPDGIDGSRGPSGFWYEMPGRDRADIPDDRTASFFHWQKASDGTNTYVGTLNVFNNGMPDDYKLRLHIGGFGSVTGSWDTELPVSLKKALAATTVFTPNLETTYQGSTRITVDQLKFTPTATTVHFTLSGPLAEQLVMPGSTSDRIFHMPPNLVLTDDHGHVLRHIQQDSGSTLDGLSYQNHGRDWFEIDAVFNPVTEHPASLHLKMAMPMSAPEGLKGKTIFDEKVQLQW